MDVALPPCGLYKTTEEVAGVPAGRLVYFHNHGDPGPGIYLPEAWNANRAKFAPKGNTLPGPSAVAALTPLAPEGFYRVEEEFHCCAKECRKFPEHMLVQLGYNGEAQPILFVPELLPKGLAIPTRGFKIDESRMRLMTPLKVAVPPPPADGGVVH